MNSEHYNFNRKMITSLKDVLGQVSMYETTSERNLRQFRERMAANRAEREARAEELRAKRAAEEAAKNTPEAIERRLNLDRQRVDAERNRDSNTNPRTEAESALLNASLARLRKAGENPQMPKRDPGQNAGKIRPAGQAPDLDAQGRPRSINLDGSFNIPQAAQAEKNTTEVSQRERERGTATERGRLAQRLPSWFTQRGPRTQDEVDQINAAKADLERAYDEGPLGYEDQGSLYAGFERRGYELGGPSKPRPTSPESPAPAPRPAPVPPRPTPLKPQAPRPTPLQPEAERPTPLKPQEGVENFDQLEVSNSGMKPPSIMALSRMRRTGLA